MLVTTATKGFKAFRSALSILKDYITKRIASNQLLREGGKGVFGRPAVR